MGTACRWTAQPALLNAPPARSPGAAARPPVQAGFGISIAVLCILNGCYFKNADPRGSPPKSFPHWSVGLRLLIAPVIVFGPIMGCAIAGLAYGVATPDAIDEANTLRKGSSWVSGCLLPFFRDASPLAAAPAAALPALVAGLSALHFWRQRERRQGAGSAGQGRAGQGRAGQGRAGWLSCAPGLPRRRTFRSPTPRSPSLRTLCRPSWGWCPSCILLPMWRRSTCCAGSTAWPTCRRWRPRPAARCSAAPACSGSTPHCATLRGTRTHGCVGGRLARPQPFTVRGFLARARGPQWRRVCLGRGGGGGGGRQRREGRGPWGEVREGAAGRLSAACAACAAAEQYSPIAGARLRRPNFPPALAAPSGHPQPPFLPFPSLTAPARPPPLVLAPPRPCAALRCAGAHAAGAVPAAAAGHHLPGGVALPPAVLHQPPPLLPAPGKGWSAERGRSAWRRKECYAVCVGVHGAVGGFFDG